MLAIAVRGGAKPSGSLRSRAQIPRMASAKVRRGTIALHEWSIRFDSRSLLLPQTPYQDSHQGQKLQAVNQELTAKNLALMIENQDLMERLEHAGRESMASPPRDGLGFPGKAETVTEVEKGLRDELEACQQHLAQKKELLAQALSQLKVFLKDEEMLESEIGENERLLEEVEDLKYRYHESQAEVKKLRAQLEA